MIERSIASAKMKPIPFDICGRHQSGLPQVGLIAVSSDVRSRLFSATPPATTTAQLDAEPRPGAPMIGVPLIGLSHAGFFAMDADDCPGFFWSLGANQDGPGLMLWRFRASTGNAVDLRRIAQWIRLEGGRVVG